MFGRAVWAMSRYSAGSRFGQTGAEATVWTSDTSLVCKLGGGVAGSLGLSVTSGEAAGSETQGVSYDRSGASSVLGVNQNTGGGGSVTVSGEDFGTSR